MNIHKNTPLTEQQIARIVDTKRLAETKLRNIEENLRRVDAQQEWVRRYQELNHELSEHRNRLYEVNKQLASISHEEKELDRYEAFETIQGAFQRMQLLERLSRENKQKQSTLVAEVETCQHEVNEAQQMLKELDNDCKDAKKRMAVVMENTQQATRINGSDDIIVMSQKTLQDNMSNLSHQRDAMKKQIEEQQLEMARLETVITQLKTKKQSMEPHQMMLEQSGKATTMLNQLNEIAEDLDNMEATQRELTTRQMEVNEELNHEFTKYQQLEEEIRTINDELHIHRQTNLGQSSYSLQERAMTLKSRRQMLISAQSLWNRIQQGFNMIEDKAQTMNSLRLSLDNMRRNIENLEKELAPLRSLCKEKEYTLTLSKSQNVIELRGDLQEGVSCTVCGATHHPYHSDTMLEQSKLISEMRSEYELMAQELRAKEERLTKMKLDFASETTRHQVEEETLALLKQRQMDDVREWQVFASLDPTFRDCSSSTNQEARTAMLRQLIENTARDAESAQAELDEYNFHQTRINGLSEELGNKELQKSDLTVRLNEVNTSCQVMAGRVEKAIQQRKNIQERYSNLYEKLGKQITLNDWFQEWSLNRDGMITRIETMAEAWKSTKEQLDINERKMAVCKATIEGLQQQDALLEADMLSTRDQIERNNTMLEEHRKKLDQLQGRYNSINDMFDDATQQVETAEQDLERQQQLTQEVMSQLHENNGRLKGLMEDGTQMDMEKVTERSNLDVWMRRFNANNSPVQYAELERVFAENKDWSRQRQEIRDTRLTATLEQSRVDTLRSAMVSLQAENMRPSNSDSPEVQATLVSLRETLEKQRRDVMMQIAEQDLALRENETLLAMIKNQEEKDYSDLVDQPSM